MSILEYACINYACAHKDLTFYNCARNVKLKKICRNSSKQGTMTMYILS